MIRAGIAVIGLIGFAGYAGLNVVNQQAISKNAVIKSAIDHSEKLIYAAAASLIAYSIFRGK